MSTTAPYCMSCGEPRSAERLKRCPICNYALCKSDDCRGDCHCTDVLGMLAREIRESNRKGGEPLGNVGLAVQVADLVLHG
jgi:hypothetical protein